MKSILKFLCYTLLFAVFTPTIGASEIFAPALAIGAGILCTVADGIGWKTPKYTAYINGIDVELWKKYIIEKFRKTNAFMFMSKDDSGYVLGGAVVHIPQAGNDPAVVKNRNAYPAVAVRRTDNDITYALDTYSTDPTHIPWAELQSLSYDKVDSVLGSHTAILSDTVADDLLIKWAPTGGQIIPTTGGPTALTTAGVDGQTTTRKIFHHKDLQKAMFVLDKQNVPREGRKALIPTAMLEGFYDSLTDTQLNAFQALADVKNGVIGRLHSFDIMTRSSVLAYTSGAAVKALGSAIAATDNFGALAWHPNVVCRAMGEMKPFQDKDNPLYYGDIYSQIVRMGGRQDRASGEGIVAIVQAA